MAIVRSLTKKGSRYGFGYSESASTASRSDSKRSSISKIQISAPVELISTTNMISYTSPSLRSSVSQASISSDSSGGSSPTFPKFLPSSPSSSSGEEMDIPSPDEPTPSVAHPRTQPPPPNHLSTYFSSSTNPSRSPSKPRRTLPHPPPTSAPPALNLSRNGSNRSNKLHSSASTGARGRASRSSANPFGVELAKVAEMAEDIVTELRDAEEEFMMERGLKKFSATDYTAEIGGVFDDELPSLGAGWI